MVDDYGDYVEYLPSRLVRIQNTPIARRWHLEHYDAGSEHQRDHEYVWFLYWTSDGG